MKAQLIITFILGGLLFSCQQPTGQKARQGQEAEEAVKEQTVNEVLPARAYRAKLEETSELQLVDVRTPEEYAQGHIQGAENINFFDEDFEQQLEQKLDKEQPVYIYCRSGNRSSKAAARMEALGFKAIYDLEGGYMNWPKE